MAVTIIRRMEQACEQYLQSVGQAGADDLDHKDDACQSHEVQGARYRSFVEKLRRIAGVDRRV